MNLLFLVPLVTGLVAGYVAKKSNDDLAYLSITIAGICLIVTLALTPWQLQLLLVGSVITSAGRMDWQLANHRESEPDELKTRFEKSFSTLSAASNTNGKIVRKYRGVSYEVSGVFESGTREELGGLYRGSPWSTKNDRVIMETQVSHSHLKYRGVDLTPETSPVSQTIGK
jgi:Domain of unknown function (DUF4278)